MDYSAIGLKIRKIEELPNHRICSVINNTEEARRRLCMAALQIYPVLREQGVHEYIFSIHESDPRDAERAYIRRMTTDPKLIYLYLPIRKVGHVHLFHEPIYVLRQLMFGVGLAVTGSTPEAQSWAEACWARWQNTYSKYVPSSMKSIGMSDLQWPPTGDLHPPTQIIGSDQSSGHLKRDEAVKRRELILNAVKARRAAT